MLCTTRVAMHRRIMQRQVNILNHSTSKRAATVQLVAGLVLMAVLTAM